mgnify:CR=1 FL=1
MKNKFYIGLIVIGTILFIALTCIQVLYVKNMFKVQNIIFNRTVNDAMKDALQYFHLNYLSNNEEVSDEIRAVHEEMAARYGKVFERLAK